MLFRSPRWCSTTEMAARRAQRWVRRCKGTRRRARGPEVFCLATRRDARGRPSDGRLECACRRSKPFDITVLNLPVVGPMQSKMQSSARRQHIDNGESLGCFVGSLVKDRCEARPARDLFDRRRAKVHAVHHDPGQCADVAFERWVQSQTRRRPFVTGGHKQRCHSTASRISTTVWTPPRRHGIVPSARPESPTTTRRSVQSPIDFARRR